MPFLTTHPAFRTTARLLAAVPLGYFLVTKLVAVAGALIALAGMARAEAVALAAMSGFLVYLGWLIWAFAVRSLVRLYGVTLGGLLLCVLLLRIMPQAGA